MIDEENETSFLDVIYVQCHVPQTQGKYGQYILIHQIKEYWMNRFTKRFDKRAAKSLCLPNHYVVISERTVLLDVILSWPIDYIVNEQGPQYQAPYMKSASTQFVYDRRLREWCDRLRLYILFCQQVDIYVQNKKHAYIIFSLSHMYSYSTEYLYISLSATWYIQHTFHSMNKPNLKI